MVVKCRRFDMTSFDPGFRALRADAPGGEDRDTIAEANKVIEALKTQPVGAEELQKAKNLEQSSFVFLQESIFEEALQLGVW